MGVIAERYARRAAAFDQLVAAIPASAWDNPTPCAQWNVRDVVRHVVLMHEMLLRPLGHRPAPGPTVDSDPVAAFRRVSAGMRSVLDDPTTAASGAGSLPDQGGVRHWVDGILGADLVLHGWDLARATGQDDTIDPTDVALLWPRPGTRLSRVEGLLEPPAAVAVQATATDQARLLGLNGRDPNWRLPSVRLPPPRQRRERPTQ